MWRASILAADADDSDPHMPLPESGGNYRCGSGTGIDIGKASASLVITHLAAERTWPCLLQASLLMASSDVP